MRNLLRSMSFRLGSAAALLGAAVAAQATDPYATLLAAVDFTSVTTDVIAVAALVVVVLVAIRAVRFIYGIVRR
jgi:hypothetical protein